MAMRYLGDTIDIHGGGLENIFPHHESEIAQSESATGKTFARFWLHNNMVTVDGQKMGKSLGNFTYLRDLFGEFDPMVVRLYILRSHYRSPLDFSSGGLSSARSGMERLVSFRSRLGNATGEPNCACSEEAKTAGIEAEQAFIEAMDDDLNTPGALAALFDMVRSGNALLDRRDDPVDRSFLAGILGRLAGEVLGLDLARADSAGGSVTGLCDVLGDVRGVLRDNRLFEEADGMRGKLEELGYVVKDLPEGGSEVRPR
jgi:cysteinyl-tRNA synthetase